jgi:hypothetical protein
MVDEVVKHDNFVRLATNRIAKAQDAIRVIGNLGSHNYSYSTDEAQALIDGILEATEEVRVKLGLENSVFSSPAPAPVPGDDTSEATDAVNDDEEEDFSDAVPEVITFKVKSNSVRDAAKFIPTSPEDILMLNIGPRLNKAIELIVGGQEVDAKDILLGIMAS